MSYSTSRQPFLGFWEHDLIDLVFPAPSSQAPSASPDADLIKHLGFVPGLKEILMLRQVHALEHATVWVLSNMAPANRGNSGSAAPSDNEQLSGMSTDRGFYLYGQVNPGDLRRAVQMALRRITGGEWDLAIHPRCGTNLSVSMLLTAGLALGVGVILPRDPIGQLVGLGLAVTTATQLSPDLGDLAQRYITTAIPFNLAVEAIKPALDPLGRSAHFVQVSWVE
jgi:hypothetical protein